MKRPHNRFFYSSGNANYGETILYVYHNGDGEWQFHSTIDRHLDDSLLVSLEEITKLDSSVNDVFNLQLGWRAWRASKKDEWSFEEYRDEE